MGRTRTSLPIGIAAVRVASCGAFERVLHAVHERVGGEPRPDAAYRQAVSEEAVLRRAADDVVAQRAGLWCESQTRGALDAPDGAAGDLARSAHEHAAPRTSNLPVFIAWNGDSCAEPGVVRGPDVRGDAPRLHVPDGGDGLVQPVRHRMGRIQQHGERFLRGGVETRAEQGLSRNLQHRSGQPIHERGIHRNAAGCQRAYQHGRSRPRAGQRVHRAVVAQREVRGHLPLRLRRWTCASRWTGTVLPLLQPPKAAQWVGESNTGTVSLCHVTRGKFHRAIWGRSTPALRPPTGGHKPCAPRPQIASPARGLTHPEAPATVRKKEGSHLL